MGDMSNLCCRICLSTHSKLISMESYGLRTAYEQLTGVSVEHDDGLPRELCVECATHLLKYNKLRNKSHMAYGLLYNMYINNYNDILVNEIKKLRLELDKIHSKLKYSDLIVHLDIEPDFNVIKAENSHNNDNKINCQYENNDLINKIETIDLMTDNDDSKESNIYNDDWAQSEFIVENKDVLDDIVHELSDLSHIDEKDIKSEKVKTNKIDIDIKEVEPLETNDAESDDTVHNDDDGSSEKLNNKIQHVKRVRKKQTDFKDVPCEKCELKFASERGLAVHMRLKHKFKYVMKTTRTKKKKITSVSIHCPFPCEVCGLDQSSGIEYMKHFAREHPNVKRTFMVSRFYQHICDQCGRSFIAQSVLQDHLLTHGSEYTIQCPKCDRKFKTKRQMQTHLYIHEKPLECHLCGASVTKPNMPRHLSVTHSEIKRFQCDLCGKCFTTKVRATSHKHHVHMKVPRPKKGKTGTSLRKRKKLQNHTRESETEKIDSRPPLRKRRKKQRHTQESETEEFVSSPPLRKRRKKQRHTQESETREKVLICV